MDQPPLFVESIYDALKAIVRVLGGAKSVGLMLWPEKAADDAGRRLLDCLNPERKEVLDPEQVTLLFRLARERGFHVAKHWLDAEMGYLPSTPADPKLDESREVAVIEAATLTIQRALAALEKLRAPKAALTKVA